MKNTIYYAPLLLSLICCGGTQHADKKTLGHPAIKNTSREKSLWVYINNGAVQCEFNGHPPAKTAENLIDNGIPVMASHCGSITGVMRAAVCGGATTNINLHEIATAHRAKAERLGYRPAQSLVDATKGTGYSIDECKTSQ